MSYNSLKFLVFTKGLKVSCIIIIIHAHNYIVLRGSLWPPLTHIFQYLEKIYYFSGWRASKCSMEISIFMRTIKKSEIGDQEPLCHLNILKLVVRYLLFRGGVHAPGGHFWLTHVKYGFYFIVMAWRPEILICYACLVHYSYS